MPAERSLSVTLVTSSFAAVMVQNRPSSGSVSVTLCAGFFPGTRAHNMAYTGSVSVTLFGASVPAVTAKTKTSPVGTASIGTEWLSATTICCNVGHATVVAAYRVLSVVWRDQIDKNKARHLTLDAKERDIRGQVRAYFDEIDKNKARQVALDVKEREMLQQVRSYFKRLTQNPHHNVTSTSHRVLLGEDALSVARNPAAHSLQIVAAMVLVILSV
jgi:hypothetical protein